jgi:predicted nucleic acid-binding protein
VELDDELVHAAAAVESTDLRTLDAIHVATALSLGEDLGAMCAYDARLADAAAATGAKVLAPT